MTVRLAPIVRELLGHGEPAVLVTVTDARGSTPREVGARMLVTRDRLHGTIGGGRLEHEAARAARDLMVGQVDAAVTREVPLGPALGQCCGGHVTLLLEVASADALARLEPLESAAERAAPLVVLFGAGHVGRALAGALAPLPCRVRWVDGRAHEFPPSPPEGVEVVVSARPVAEVGRVPPGCHFVVMTHSHPLDFEICEAALRRGDVAYLGLIGSATKRRRFERRWCARGFDPGRLDRLTCPIGLPGIRDKRPAVIAASVAAQLLLTFERRPAVRGTAPAEWRAVAAAAASS